MAMRIIGIAFIVGSASAALNVQLTTPNGETASNTCGPPYGECVRVAISELPCYEYAYCEILNDCTVRAVYQDCHPSCAQVTSTPVGIDGGSTSATCSAAPSYTATCEIMSGSCTGDASASIELFHSPPLPCGHVAPFRIQRPVPTPPVPAATYVSLEAGNFNWGGGLCVEGFENNPTTCRQHCDADPTCIGYETGDADAERFHGVHCCLEFCSPPGTGDGRECECWVTGTVPEGWNAVTRNAATPELEGEARAWTYHHKIAAGTMDAGSGPDVGSTCTQSACTDALGDCCSRPEIPGEAQSCGTAAGLYPVSIGWCGGDGGHYTCCPYGVTPTAAQVADKYERCELTSDLFTNGGCWAETCEPYRQRFCDNGPCQAWYARTGAGIGIDHNGWCAAPFIGVALGAFILIIIVGSTCITVGICCLCPGCPCYNCGKQRQPPQSLTPIQPPTMQMTQPPVSAVGAPMPMATAVAVPMQPAMATATAVAVP